MFVESAIILRIGMHKYYFLFIVIYYNCYIKLINNLQAYI